MTENTMSWKRDCCAPILLALALALALVWSPLSVFGGIIIDGGIIIESRRIALVIGNADYEHDPNMKNAANDAAAVGAALERLGFEVDRVENAGFTAMRHSLVTFAQDAARADIVMVFFSGIGAWTKDRNFLAPVDFRGYSDDDMEFRAVPLQLVLRAAERASDYGIVIVDAPHDSPVDPPLGTLVAYAASAGEVVWDSQSISSDSDTQTSPYTTVLLRYLEEPGLDVGEMLRKVRDAVRLSTETEVEGEFPQHPVAYGWLPAEGVYLTAPAVYLTAPSAEALAAER